MYTAIREPDGSIHFVVHAPAHELSPKQAAEALSALGELVRGLDTRAGLGRPDGARPPRLRASKRVPRPRQAAGRPRQAAGRPPPSAEQAP